ncbi:FAD/NAD(P)-binding domain-containing protein [Aaosphaeria arxii CBS 175.79]|uniref:FAD/NAD(P)-binding domain-containing protein n=1 Tax=Aaosphaeria arxii CBS 175.79 TaxID=1450172 RepID=A0A6A5XIL2_9PLEO|nr:FAD/NAD(P)-binding domain-containing protein [Aaosphaeria arxii CBS 175.79]KAF2012793.1 FAD/NAD(P)-binding domain-containing protein [Aaosphaeria arxii CBS 175.79]
MPEPSPPSAPSTLIVGAGILGTSTAYHLSLSHPDPSKITVLDRTPFPPSHAASTDINKIVRADYTSRFYMDLAYEALDAWKTWPVLQNEEGERFFHESGWIMLNNRGNDLAERIRKNFRERGSDVTSDVALDQALRERWDGLLTGTQLEGFDTGYWNPNAGWADASDAVAAMLQDALKRGVRYETGDVDGLVRGAGGVHGVKTKSGRVYEADKILLATGAWTSQLLSPVEDELNIADDDRVEKQVTAAGVCVVHYKLNEAEYARVKDVPVVIYGDRGEILPPPRGSSLLKFTNSDSFTNTIITKTGRKISAPPDHDQSIVSDRLKQETLDEMVSTTLPEFTTRTVDYWRICWDAISPSQDQLLTRHPHPELRNLYLAVGGSFHSWKFLPTIGKYVVNVLNGQSNGEEKDSHWQWKTSAPKERGAHEKVIPKRELRDLD